jgi:hypothetical protein
MRVASDAACPGTARERSARRAGLPRATLLLLVGLLAGPAPPEAMAREVTVPPAIGPEAPAPMGVDTLSLSGIVTVAGGGEPIVGATAEIATLERAAVTDAAGRFTIGGLPEGAHQVEIRALGYRTVRVTLSVPRTQPIQVGLSVEPLELEGITVEAVIESAERNLERRRRAYPGTVRVITREHLDRSAGFVSNAVQSYGAFIVDCVDRAGRPIPGEARQCVNLRGERSHRPLVCIDGRRALDGIRQLDSYGPESLHSVEVYGGGRMIQAYTHAYLRWQGAGRLPVGLIDC